MSIRTSHMGFGKKSVTLEVRRQQNKSLFKTTVKNSIARLVELDEMVSTGAAAGLTKKETLMLERERAKLDRSLSGIRDMKGLPDALFIIDVNHEVKEDDK